MQPTGCTRSVVPMVFGPTMWPTPPERGQALVRVPACSLNYRDLLVSKGLYNRNLPLPLGSPVRRRGGGRGVGPGVTRVRAGDRVAPRSCRLDRRPRQRCEGQARLAAAGLACFPSSSRSMRRPSSPFPPT